MRDRRTLVMIGVTVLVAAFALVYLIFDRPGDTGGWAMPAGAVILLLLIVALSAGASRGRRVVRDEEEIDPVERRDG